MEYFSVRNKLVNINHNQLNEMSAILRERIWATFYKEEYDTIDYSGYTTGIEDMMIEMGVPFLYVVITKTLHIILNSYPLSRLQSPLGKKKYL